MLIDLTPAEKALKSLSGAIDSALDEEFMGRLTDIQQKTIRAGVIQNFEFSYELCWKMLRRILIELEGSEEITQLSRKDLFRLAAQKGLMADPEKWFIFHRARNEASHTYNEAKANEVFNIACDFISSANKLMLNLINRND
ncbi:HI0074 family nucleotidyltransferase substrate-binding subunit [uncultured Neptuniibacter sp.]|uniref:HI0074 family nucleotidyltransferase substrate-binding subunit n=1 Tax=uncultured Neptuniibacter sp. TaxID=502143 RepID=UPI0032B1BE8F|tara:strand:+ start:7081 stop:7503 length:423 start_codon:yes stop_codon:yes gene_type:complete